MPVFAYYIVDIPKIKEYILNRYLAKTPDKRNFLSSGVLNYAFVFVKGIMQACASKD